MNNFSFFKEKTLHFKIKKGYITCKACGKRVEKNQNIKNTRQKYCSECSEKIRKEYKAQKMKEYRKKNSKNR